MQSREEINATKRKRWQVDNKRAKAKLRERAWRYAGIDPQEANAALTAHDGKCGVCATDTPGVKGWQVDHAHATGRVRGILCFRCNVQLGVLEKHGEKLSAYLRKHL